jgi:CRP-like cAMP-binding protein
MISGFACRQKLLAGGSRQIISVHLMGDGIDLLNAFLALTDHGIEALSPSKIAVVPSAAISELAGSSAAIARAILVETLLDMAVQQEWTANSRRDARSRIAHLLCELGLRFEAADLGKRDFFDLPLTQDQIADTTGLTAVHVNRVLQSLRAEGLIGRQSSPFRILDWDRLKTVGDFSSRYLRPLATAA